MYKLLQCLQTLCAQNQRKTTRTHIDRILMEHQNPLEKATAASVTDTRPSNVRHNDCFQKIPISGSTIEFLSLWPFPEDYIYRAFQACWLCKPCNYERSRESRRMHSKMKAGTERQRTRGKQNTSRWQEYYQTFQEGWGLLRSTIPACLHKVLYSIASIRNNNDNNLSCPKRILNTPFYVWLKKS